MRRDQIQNLCNGALCVETEAAGVDASRSCLVIRGISDYADSHKGDTWRSYAAGNAAIFARELLSKILPSKILSLGSQDGPKSHFLVPFGRNEGFVGRDEVLTQLLQRIPPATREQDCQRTVVDGLGGIGKTQVAIEAAYRVRDTSPDCSVFWVPAVSMPMFENAYRDIGQALEIKGIQEDKADVKSLVKAALSRDDAGSWLLIIDNVDDSELLASDKLTSYLPFSRKGSILFTTRNHQVAARLDTRRGVFELGDMDSLEASQLLHQNLQPSQIADRQITAELVEHLAKLPLAIRQASAYMAKNPNVTASTYLDFCKSSDATLVELLSKDFDDRDRYDVIQNPVATTWLVSFEQVSRNRLAAEYLGMICFLAEKDIPVSLLPRGNELLEHEAIGILRSYAFVSQRHSTDRLDVHRLVRLVMLNWLKEQGKEEKQITMTIHRLSEVFPWPEHENRDIWAAYLPHAQAVLDLRAKCKDHLVLGHLLNYVGRSLYLLGKFKEAEKILRQVLQLSKKVLGREHPDTLGSMNNLADVLRSQGEYEEAEQIHRQTLVLRKKFLGEEHPDTLGSMNNLAAVLRGQGEYEEAEQVHRQTLGLSEKILGREHPTTLSIIDNLKGLLRSKGEYEEAEKIYS